MVSVQGPIPMGDPLKNQPPSSQIDEALNSLQTFLFETLTEGADQRLLLEGLPNGRQVLDLGAGGGSWSVFMSKKGHHVTAVDVADVSFQYDKLNAVLEGHLLPSIQFQEARVETFLQETKDHKQKYDVIILSNIIGFLGDLGCLKYVQDCLSDNGRVYICGISKGRTFDNPVAGPIRLVDTGLVDSCFPEDLFKRIVTKEHVASNYAGAPTEYHVSILQKAP